MTRQARRDPHLSALHSRPRPRALLSLPIAGSTAPEASTTGIPSSVQVPAPLRGRQDLAPEAVLDSECGRAAHLGLAGRQSRCS